MADYSKAPVAAAAADTDVDSSVDNNSKASYWKQVLNSYERRNASLERRRNALVERVRFMECTLPSLLVGAAASAAYGKRTVSEGHPRAPES